jgi:hypothetical protein
MARVAIGDRTFMDREVAYHENQEVVIEKGLEEERGVRCLVTRAVHLETAHFLPLECCESYFITVGLRNDNLSKPREFNENPVLEMTATLTGFRWLVYGAGGSIRSVDLGFQVQKERSQCVVGNYNMDDQMSSFMLVEQAVQVIERSREEGRGVRCPTARAIHLECEPSLSAKSCEPCVLLWSVVLDPQVFHVFSQEECEWKVKLYGCVDSRGVRSTLWTVQEDKFATSLPNVRLLCVGGRIERLLYWKTDDTRLPDNQHACLKRPRIFHRRLTNDPLQWNDHLVYVKGLMEMSSRLPANWFPAEARQLMILPSSNRIIDEAQRLDYWPAPERPVKKVARCCIQRRMRRPGPVFPLPVERVAIRFRAFAACGVAFRAAKYVVFDRGREEGRGVCCLLTRAVYLERAEIYSDATRFSTRKRTLNSTELRVKLGRGEKKRSLVSQSEEAARAGEKLVRTAQVLVYTDVRDVVSDKSILRVNGLLPADLYAVGVRRPVNVPASGRIVVLCERNVPAQLMNETRQTFHSPGLRRLVKTVNDEYFRVRRPGSMQPQQGTRPVVVDYVRPTGMVIVTIREKRWGVLFTRAVHLASAYTLLMESWIMGAKIICARRDATHVEMRSFFWTKNLIGRNQELRSLDILPALKWTCGRPEGRWEQL